MMNTIFNKNGMKTLLCSEPGNFESNQMERRQLEKGLVIIKTSGELEFEVRLCPFEGMQFIPQIVSTVDRSFSHSTGRMI